jgi:hypothetical protein
MGRDETTGLGADEIAGTKVNPKGTTKGMTAAVAGRVVGGAIGSLAVSAVVGRKGAPDMPSFGRVGYLAASESEVAIIKTKTGALKMKITNEVLARAPRSEITSIEWDGGFMLSHLSIGFANEVVWRFDVPKSEKKTAEAFVRAIGGTA